jgi:hypothetical protein
MEVVRNNAEKTKYVLLSHHQNAGQNRDMKVGTDHLKICHSSNIWGQQKQIKI